jgi:hypothetical protein
LKNVFGGLRVRQIGFAVLATALLSASLTLAFATGGARAADPPPPPPPTTTLPSPDPAPPPPPKPPPPPPPKPTPHHTSPPPSPSPPPPVFTPPPVSTHPAVAPAKHHVTQKRRHKKPVAPQPVPAPVTTTPTPAPVQPVVQFHTVSEKKSGPTIQGLLVISGLALAIACFALAAVPVTRVRWRPAAILVSERRTDLTIVGFSLLIAAALTYFWIKGG